MDKSRKIHIGVVCDQFGNFDRGGAEVQIDNTLNALNRIDGVTTEIITSHTKDVERFDIVHFFKSSIGYYPFVLLLIKKHIPYVVSTIIFPENYKSDLLKYKISRNVPLIKGISWMRLQYVLWDNAARLFPNTDMELTFLRDIDVKSPAEIIPNGLNIDEMSEASEEMFFELYPLLRAQKFVLNVARIDQRKNQKRLLLACKELDIPLVLIGNNLDKKSFDEIQNINYDKLYYLGPIFDKSVLFGAIKACSVFCLPSTMETPGIAAMEAAYFNRPLVITKFGGTQYYFKDKAYYVDWRNVTEIKDGIKSMSQNQTVFTQDLMKQYSWNNIAQLYTESYYKIISSK